MYKFRRRIYIGDRSMEFWFGVTSKSRDRHSNFTLLLLTGGPDSPSCDAVQIKRGIPTKSEVEKLAVRYAKDLLRSYIEREKEGDHAAGETDSL